MKFRSTHYNLAFLIGATVLLSVNAAAQVLPQSEGASSTQARPQLLQVRVESQSDPNPDFDRNGVVEFPDFVLFARRFGVSRGDETFEARYDLDGDGNVGFSDFLIFARNFGKSVTIPTTGICGRTPQVRRAILNALPDMDDCALVTDVHLHSIRSLDLKYGRITALMGDDFSGLDSLRAISLEFNDISSLPEGVFSGLVKLVELDLSRNKMKTLSDGLFSGLVKLRVLKLQGNGLTTLPEGVFSGLDSLKVLEIGFSDVYTVSDDVFSGLTPDLDSN